MARDLLACPECNLEAENFAVALSGENDDDLDYECPGCGALISRGELRRKRIFSIYGGDDDLNQAQTLELIDQALRGRFYRDYTQPMIGQKNATEAQVSNYANGLVTDGAVAGVPTFAPQWDNGNDQNFGGIGNRGEPYIVGVVSGGGSPGETAEMVECYNNEPYGFSNGAIDAMWGFYNTVRVACFIQGIVTSTAAGNRFGVEFGSAFGQTASNANGAAMSDGAVHFALFYDMFLAKWTFRINNRFGSVGHRTFSVDLGANPKGITTPVVSVPYWLELRWFPSPNNDSKVEAWINNIKVYTFTDRNDGAGDFPLKGIFDNRATNGETIKGGGIFVTSIALNDQLKVAFMNLHCETWALGGFPKS